METTVTKSDVKDFLYDIQSKKDLSISTILKDRKNVLDLRIIVILDVSGSISTENFLLFMQRIDKIRGLSMVKIIEFSVDIVAIYDYFKVQQNEIMRLRGGNGTNFVKAFEAAKRMNPDSILFLSDGMDVGERIENPNIPTGAILTHNNQLTYDWMKVIEILPPDKNDIDTKETQELRKDVSKDIDDDNKMLDDFKDNEEEDEDEY